MRISFSLKRFLRMIVSNPIFKGYQCRSRSVSRLDRGDMC